jgi:hypothetical protein
MPTVLRIEAYRFHFYSDENKEPPHIHVAHSDGECKFWLEPVMLASNINLHPHTVRIIERLVFENKDLLIKKYREYHVY